MIRLAALALPCVAFAAEAQVTGPPGPVSVFLVEGQSNMTVQNTGASYGVAPPDLNGAYDAVFIGSASATPLPPVLIAKTRVAPSANSGALVVSSVAIGRVYAGQQLGCAGCAPGTVIASDQIGDGRGGVGSYVITPAQTLPAGTVFTAAEPDTYAGGGGNPAIQIWNDAASAWQTYLPGVNSQSASWGPEGAFCADWLVDHPGQTCYLIKSARIGTYLCMIRQNGSNWSPESGDLFAAAAATARRAEAALLAQGLTYQVTGFLWGQGEQDAGAGASSGCAAAYGQNLVDLINNVATPETVTASFTGAINGAVLTVAATQNGTIQPGQTLTAPGVPAHTVIGAQIDGVPGGAGDYALEVYQASGAARTERITDATSGAWATGALIGQNLYIGTAGAGVFSPGDVITGANIAAGTVLGAEQPVLFSGYVVGGVLTITQVTSGYIEHGLAITGPGVAPGTTITSLVTAAGATGTYRLSVKQTVGSAAAPVAMAGASGGVGLYGQTVPMTIAPEPMTASIPGWGVGADSQTFVLFNIRYSASNEPVPIAQRSVNFTDNPAAAALPATTFWIYDALPNPATPIHNNPSWIAELGRRFYLAWKAPNLAAGGCDYHSATC